MTSDEMIVRILLNACDVLEKRGWTQGSMARDANGDACDINSVAAASYCLSGALVKSWRELDLANETFYFPLFETRFSEILLRRHSYKGTLTRWNDDIAKHRESVVELIYAVIKSIQSGPSVSFRPTDVPIRFDARLFTVEPGETEQASTRHIGEASPRALTMRAGPTAPSCGLSQPERLRLCGQRCLALHASPVRMAMTRGRDAASRLRGEVCPPCPARDAYRTPCIC